MLAYLHKCARICKHICSEPPRCPHPLNTLRIEAMYNACAVRVRPGPEQSANQYIRPLR